MCPGIVQMRFPNQRSTITLLTLKDGPLLCTGQKSSSINIDPLLKALIATPRFSPIVCILFCSFTGGFKTFHHADAWPGESAQTGKLHPGQLNVMPPTIVLMTHCSSVMDCIQAIYGGHDFQHEHVYHTLLWC